MKNTCTCRSYNMNWWLFVIIKSHMKCFLHETGQPIMAHSSTTALIQQPVTGTIQRIQVPAVIQQTPAGSQPPTHTLTINQLGTPQPAAPAQQVGLAQVGNTVVGVVSSAMGSSIAQGSEYTCTFVAPLSKSKRLCFLLSIHVCLVSM